ncbi:MAG: PVC-type heme-binding CxxCH protein [Luteolibacter sp.]|uniref:PVC-type heme-binding CxxCH protein n=1 Tax=Luteolibacter sp. TaxID=1962973 RepID=UPI003263D10B
MKKILILPLGILAAAIGLAQTTKQPTAEARHVEILFLGAPTANHPGHDPVERYRVLKKALGVDGIDLTYTEDLADLRSDVLNEYDGVMFYGNWKDNEAMDGGQFKALTDYVNAGHAFLPIHCASACFGGTDAFSKLVGGHFKSHSTGVFKTTIAAKDHPIMRDYEGFETWDETYVHDRLTDDRTVLQLRDNEPWTWVRDQGKGKVFYTAYGHDMRCWQQPAFHDLLRRAILWSVGSEVRAKVAAMKLPKLEQEEMILPGYRDHKTITSGQKPLTPTESMKLAQVPVGYELSLFASDPDIVNPIYVTWDYKGRAYVIETVDYPNNLQKGDLGHDRIHLCEDTNGDGKADKFTLFADKLSIPTSAIFVNGGLICTNGPDMMFLKDTNGDNVADVRQVLFTGFNNGDTHAGVSNLRIGLDNWIYATIGYSGFKGTVGGEQLQFSSGFFRFKPDGSKLEFLQNTTNNTWGLGFTSAFDILGSTANGNPSWYFTFAKEIYQGAGLPQPKTPPGDNNPMYFPSSMDIRQVDQFDRYTAGAGHAFYTSTRFPENYRDKIAFVTEATGKLVGQFEITPKGAGYVSRQLPNNLYNSADGWSGPVHAETGPDGAVWICDWYNLIIQHNPTPNKNSAGYDAQTGKGNAYETPIRDKTMGRMYRVYPKGSKDDVNPKLDPANLDSLLAGLSHPNLFWRIQAQSLIVESRSTTAAAKLKELLKVSSSKTAAVHAMYILKALGALDAETVKAALASSDRGLFRAGLLNAPSDNTLADSVIQGGVIKAPDARLLAETFVALAGVAPSDAIGKALHATLVANKDSILADATLSDAWQIAARKHAAGVILSAVADTASATSSVPVNLLPDPGFTGTGLGPWSLRPYAVDRPGTVELSIAPGGRNGGTALKITSPFRADAGAGATIPVKPNTRYRLGGWVRTENLENKGGQGAMLNVHGGSATKGISGTQDWTELSMEFNSGNQSEILVHCLFGGYGGGTGTAWFDDLYLNELGSGDVSGSVDAVVKYFAAKADPAARQAVATALSSRTDSFSKNLVASLGAAPVAVKEIIRKNKPDPAVHERGLAVYSRTCIACHGPDGKGVPGAFPPLDGSSWPVGDPTVPARILLLGLQGPIEVAGLKFENIMPPHTDLKDAEIADVLTYVRQSWSNDAPSVSEDLVKQTRAKFMSRGKPWTAAELK